MREGRKEERETEKIRKLTTKSNLRAEHETSLVFEMVDIEIFIFYFSNYDAFMCNWRKSGNLYLFHWLSLLHLTAYMITSSALLFLLYLIIHIIIVSHI